MMSINRKLICLSFFALLFCCSTAISQTSVFTYQGKLTDMNAAANGQYDFTFKLFDAAVNGTQIGTDVVLDNVQVSGGIFTATMDFGASSFSNGAPRFLEISVRAGAGTGAFTPLAPRQEITSAPFSIKTLSAVSADSLSSSCSLCVTDAQIQSIAGSKVTGTVSNATNATNATNAATAGNVTGVVQIANGGTGSSTKNFVDLSTTQTGIGGDKTFTGVLSGNGAGLTNIPGTLKWQTVSGLAQQAQSNNGYLANNDAQVTLTLPTAPNVGDVVRVSGVGSGGWKIAQNAGQLIIGTNIGLSIPWNPRESNRAWTTIASSADGTKLVAGEGNGFLYTSTDSGNTWTARPFPGGRAWTSIASSADGTKLVAVANVGQIYTSADSGVTWTPRESARAWQSVASSADGTKLVAAVQNGQIYTSTDSGANWTPRQINRSWRAVASSADGTKLVAAVDAGNILTSADSGVNWTFAGINPNFWLSVASSADGTKLVALGRNTQIYTSTDSGVSWTPRDSSRVWYSVASSADGTKLVAIVGEGGQIYRSTDSGVTWTPEYVNRLWTWVASSADGTKLAATVFGGQIYTKNTLVLGFPSTTTGTPGFLTGGQFSAIELQYIGSGQFLPLSYSGGFQGF